jgi:hypothetical protein
MFLKHGPEALNEIEMVAPTGFVCWWDSCVFRSSARHCEQ